MSGIKKTLIKKPDNKNRPTEKIVEITVMNFKITIIFMYKNIWKDVEF